jgi:hypothetical protein
LVSAVSVTRQLSGYSSIIDDGTPTVDLGPDGGGFPHCWGDYQGAPASGSVSVFIADTATYSRHTFWNYQPSDLSEIRAFAITQDLPTTPQLVGFTGPSGVATQMALYVNSFTRRSCGAADSFYTLAQVIMTKDVAP